MPMRESVGQILRAELSSNLCRNSPRTKSSELSSHQMSIRALVRQEVQDFSASRCPFEVISECSLLTRTHSLMGRVPLQLKGCPTVYILKLTHHAIGGVAVQYLHLRGTPPLQHISAVWSCGYRLHPCRGVPSSLSTSSWYVYSMRAMV